MYKFNGNTSAQNFASTGVVIFFFRYSSFGDKHGRNLKQILAGLAVHFS